MTLKSMWMWKYLIGCFLLTLMEAPVFGQKKLIDKLEHKFLSNEKDTVRKNTFFPFPVAALSPETGLEYGVAALYSFYLDKTDTITRVSTLNIMGTHTTHNQTKFKLIGDIWSRQNTYHYSGVIRYQDFPYGFYGIGSKTHAADKEYIKEQRLLLSFAADRKVAPNYYVGVQVGFERYNNTGSDADGIYSGNDYYGKPGGKRLYFGVEQLYDTRNNVTYTTKGAFAQLTVNYTPDVFNGEQYQGVYGAFDGRYFTPLNKKMVLAFNGVYQGIYGDQDKIPFYLMPQFGGEDIMRGYYQGRFRDQQMAALQAELRYRIIPRVALVGFGGAGTVFGRDPLTMAEVKPNYGLGIRYFFDLNKDLTIRLDYGFGEKRPGEQRMSGFYFSMNEAF